MLASGRIPLSTAEHQAVDRLLARHGAGSFTRELPGETGPLLVHLAAGVWRVQGDGTARKVKGA